MYFILIGRYPGGLNYHSYINPNPTIVKSPIKFMFLCACVNYVKLIPIKSAMEHFQKIGFFTPRLYI